MKTAPPVPLPGPLRLSPTFAFAGRTHELATLRALLPRSAGEGRRAALVAGDPGSGKSRLVRELARDVAEEGATVLYGDCDAVVGSPYGPFAAALEHLVSPRGPRMLRRHLGAASGELTRLLPELEPRIGALPGPVATDADTERHRLHTAVTDLLVGVSSEAPLLVVLEDVHWADASTLQLLRHLVRSGAAARMLLVATFRDAEADVPEALAETLVDVYRTEGVARIRLGGLSERRDRRVRATRGRGRTGARAALRDRRPDRRQRVPRDRALARAARAGAIEIGPGGALLARPAAELGAPTTVREVVNQRLSRLSAETNEVLALAAVAGADFELETVRRAEVVPEPVLLDAVDEAVRNGLLVEEPGRRSRTASRTSSCGVR